MEPSPGGGPSSGGQWGAPLVSTSPPNVANPEEPLTAPICDRPQTACSPQAPQRPLTAADPQGSLSVIRLHRPKASPRRLPTAAKPQTTPTATDSQRPPPAAYPENPMAVAGPQNPFTAANPQSQGPEQRRGLFMAAGHEGPLTSKKAKVPCIDSPQANVSTTRPQLLLAAPNLQGAKASPSPQKRKAATFTRRVPTTTFHRGPMSAVKTKGQGASTSHKRAFKATEAMTAGHALASPASTSLQRTVAANELKVPINNASPQGSFNPPWGFSTATNLYHLGTTPEFQGIGTSTPPYGAFNALMTMISASGRGAHTVTEFKGPSSSTWFPDSFQGPDSTVSFIEGNRNATTLLDPWPSLTASSSGASTGSRPGFLKTPFHQELMIQSGGGHLNASLPFTPILPGGGSSLSSTPCILQAHSDPCQASFCKELWQYHLHRMVLLYIIPSLNMYGFYFMDHFAGSSLAELVLQEVIALHRSGIFRAGELASTKGTAGKETQIRGDEILWVEGNEQGCEHIGVLLSCIDTAIVHADGNLGHYKIQGRHKVGVVVVMFNIALEAVRV